MPRPEGGVDAMTFEEWWAKNSARQVPKNMCLDAWNAALSSDRDAWLREKLGPIEELITAWRGGIKVLKEGIEDSPSHDLKRMINERAEATLICTNELLA